MEELIEVARISSIDKTLTLLLDTEKKIGEIASGEIVFKPALITRDGIPIIRRGTITTIQGGEGSHKSRLAELLCSMLLRETPDLDKSLGFEKTEEESLAVCYIDTERNNTEEFPMAVQSIFKNAGYEAPGDIPEFRYTSLKNVDRNKRLEAVKKFLNEIKKDSSLPMFVVLDVITDCIQDFNNAKESMALFDYIGGLCEEYETTFLLVIHVNPNTEKPRGHAGTESLNKSATVIHIGFELGKNRERTELIQLKYKKLRHSTALDPISVVFAKESKSLKLADPAFVKSILALRSRKAPIDEVVNKLGHYLVLSLKQQVLFNYLMNDFECSKNTIKDRIDKIAKDKLNIYNASGVLCTLSVTAPDGKETMYELIESDVEDLV